MNFKNPFKKDNRSEFQKSQAAFSSKIKTTGERDLGIEDELLNMRAMIYMTEGDEGVERFDKRLWDSFGHYQQYLMGEKEINFGGSNE